jgi:hypothetical protein
MVGVVSVKGTTGNVVADVVVERDARVCYE